MTEPPHAPHHVSAETIRFCTPTQQNAPALPPQNNLSKNRLLQGSRQKRPALALLGKTDYFCEETTNSGVPLSVFFPYPPEETAFLYHCNAPRAEKFFAPAGERPKLRRRMSVNHHPPGSIMDTLNLGTTRDESFLREVEKESGQNLSLCYQCGNCTAGCPCGPEYDMQVNQVMRALQLGDREAALSARSLWLCVSCSTCTSRCPNNIDVAKVMDVLRHMAWRSGKRDYAMASFWQSFLTTVRHFGRSYELGIMAMYMARTGRVLTDTDLAPRILPKNKLPFKPHQIVGKEQIGRIFKRFDEQRRAEGGKI